MMPGDRVVYIDGTRGVVVWDGAAPIIRWDRYPRDSPASKRRLTVVPPTSSDLTKWMGRWRTREQVMLWLAQTPEWRGATRTVRRGVVTLTHPSGAKLTLRGFTDYPDSP